MENIIAFIKYTAAALSIMGLIFLGNTDDFLVDVHENAVTVPIEETPMVSAETLSAYKNGEISKETAQERIESHLNDLVLADAIRDWDYELEDSAYIVETNNGCRFKYHLED